MERLEADLVVREIAHEYCIRISLALCARHSAAVLRTGYTMAPKFDLSTPKGMGAFNGYISSKSYVEGYAYSQVRPSIEDEQVIRASCCRCAIAVCPTLRVVD